MQKIISQERTRSKISPDKLGQVLYGEKYYNELKKYLQAAPVIPHTPNIYNKSRVQIIKDAYRYLPLIYNHNQNHAEGLHSHISNTYSFMVNPHQIPGMVHFGMFITYIDLMGTQEHKKMYLQKAINCQIMGCYAQTQAGHGSDIRGLQTVAVYDHITKQWIINSPTASSAKYWPGELSFLANYAIVFAQTIVKGNNYGVNPFLVQIKDKNYDWLPGIEGGDVGPKIGFHAKQHGYMYLRNIRIPKNNLFTKYAEINDNGEFKQVGDPRIGYGTMMFIRQLISCVAPRIFAQALIIATRYSFFRTQGLNQEKEEMRILDYQTQQEKILPRIAQYYAMTIAGMKINSVSQQNGLNVLKKDFSLLQETHSNLCFSKSLFSQISQDGIEIIRRSMGGHGTSYYSGIPQILNQFTANNTHEGDSTVLYIQTARYVLKSYLGYITKGKYLSESVKYIERFQFLENIEFSDSKEWTIYQFRDALIKTLNYLIGMIGSRMTNRGEGEEEKDVINYSMGLRVQQLAQLHGVHFCVHQFIVKIDQVKDENIKKLLISLCKLFAVEQIQRLAEPVIESGSIDQLKWNQLRTEKQAALKEIRPHTVILLDSFGYPDKYLRSQVVRGNPYQNFINRVRQSEINDSVTKSALEVGKIKEVLSAKPKL